VARSETPAADRFDLDRFIEAQRDIYPQALNEIRAAQKRGHWMWFVFPQIQGLGFSETSRRYAIEGLGEARAYLAHPLLGPRLVACAEAMLALPGRSALEILGSPDDSKLRSSTTLFAEVSPTGSVFHQVLERYFDGQADERTLNLLK
jgi:uncharacterized protein (DUF1810 family)